MTFLAEPLRRALSENRQLKEENAELKEARDAAVAALHELVLCRDALLAVAGEVQPPE